MEGVGWSSRLSEVLGAEPTGPAAEFGGPSERQHHQAEAQFLIPTTEGTVAPRLEPDPSLTRGPFPLPMPQRE